MITHRKLVFDVCYQWSDLQLCYWWFSVAVMIFVSEQLLYFILCIYCLFCCDGRLLNYSIFKIASEVRTRLDVCKIPEFQSDLAASIQNITYLFVVLQDCVCLVCSFLYYSYSCVYAQYVVVRILCLLVCSFLSYFCWLEMICIFSSVSSIPFIMKMCLFKYIELFTSKNWKFSDKNWYFSYFCSKHRLWVLVRTASPRLF